MSQVSRLLLLAACGLLTYGLIGFHQRTRKRRFERGRRLSNQPSPRIKGDAVQFGALRIPEHEVTQHFLAVGTTGSGKSLVQRLLMKDALLQIGKRLDQRALILDAKNDAADFLEHIGVSCPVYSMNPFVPGSRQVQSVSWDIGSDITSPARALNLAAALLPSEKGGNNQYFTDAARMVVSGVIESFIRHSRDTWTFSDLIYGALSLSRVKQLLSRDEEGKEIIENFLADERTGYQVFTTVASRLSYFRPIAAIWQNSTTRLSLREWLENDSVLILGVNATSRAALDAVNQILFRVIVEEIDVQADSTLRRTWVWIDEARLAGPLLRGEMLPYLAVKGRSRGAALVLAFQDIEGFREAAGPRIAHELIAQCSHKALLRMESEESATWASRLVGQFESLELMRSGKSFSTKSYTEQVTKKDAVLPSEFYTIQATNKVNGLTGYFLSPSVGAVRGTIRAETLNPIITRPSAESVRADMTSQRLAPWNSMDRSRLLLEREPEYTQPRLRLRRHTIRTQQEV